MFKKKRGFTLIECIIYIFIGTIITSISLKILVDTSIVYKKIVENSEDINNVESAFVNIERLFRNETIERINSTEDTIEILEISKNKDKTGKVHYEKEELLKEGKNLIVKYYDLINTPDYKMKNVLLENISDFKVYKKGKLKYLVIIKDNKEYIKCL
ncbi:MAG: hypothetical protein E7214_15580 [Clostridium sp.]|nr:hypothetical protein [Clostridium sp.]